MMLRDAVGSLVAMALVLGARAFVPLSALAPSTRSGGSSAADAGSVMPRSVTASVADSSLPQLAGACAAVVALLGAAAGSSRRQRRSRKALAVIVRRAEEGEVEPADLEAGESPGAAAANKYYDIAPGTVVNTNDLPRGERNMETGEFNFVNPWFERSEDEMKIPRSVQPIKSGHRFLKYTGPVYNKVPIIENLQFPLDPELYYPPLLPPPPGAKWGDGRSPDGNWYMEVDGKEVQYWQGVGKRKIACAIVRLVEGSGQFLINGREAIEYFANNPIWWLKACEPLAALSQKNEFDIIVKAFGGGPSGQAGAIRLALARAMQEYNFNWRPLMKKSKYLTRDHRMVEPKKTGLHKARKKKPYHKR
eukprot:TRINITY_DN60785_c0_g1_i1.p1 TRINITY_DN60785_c0_g1~~TRINITY_DN60785_c0_g1_i1.p1  ORF type:complete len:363 (-),score=77.53 TRINITY_DN60785_c0_g1_i1:69-1157(-)